MFEETFRPPDAASRLRRVALVALWSFIVTELYFTTAIPFFPSIPAVVDYLFDALALSGALFGAIASIRIAIREKLDGRALVALVAALALAALNAWIFAAMTFPLQSAISVAP